MLFNPVMAKLNFQQPLQSSVSHDSSQFLLNICEKPCYIKVWCEWDKKIYSSKNPNKIYYGFQKLYSIKMFFNIDDN